MRNLNIVLGFILAYAWVGVALAQEAKVSYKVFGDYVEGCACTLVCACDLGEDASAKGGCQATMVWHIEKGNYMGVNLEGLTMVGMLMKPTRNIGASLGKMEAGLYIDEKATVEQRKALEALFKDKTGAFWGKINGPKYVAIAFNKKEADSEGLSDEYRVEIPKIFVLENSAFKNKSGKRSVRLNTGEDLVIAQYIAKSTVHNYDDKDWKTSWDLSGKNSFYGRFEYAK